MGAVEFLLKPTILIGWSLNHVESTLPRLFSVAVEWLECFEWLGLAMGLFASKNRSFRQIHKQRWERELCKLLVHSPSESMLMPLHRKLPSHVTQLIQTLQLRSNFRTQSKKENPAGRTGGRRTRRTKRTTRARKENRCVCEAKTEILQDQRWMQRSNMQFKPTKTHYRIEASNQVTSDVSLYYQYQFVVRDLSRMTGYRLLFAISWRMVQAENSWSVLWSSAAVLQVSWPWMFGHWKQNVHILWYFLWNSFPNCGAS